MKAISVLFLLVMTSISSFAFTSVEVSCRGDDSQFTTNVPFKTYKGTVFINVDNGVDIVEHEFEIDVLALEEGAYYKNSKVFVIRGLATQANISFHVSAKITGEEVEYIGGRAAMTDKKGNRIGECSTSLGN